MGHTVRKFKLGKNGKRIILGSDGQPKPTGHEYDDIVSSSGTIIRMFESGARQIIGKNGDIIGTLPPLGNKQFRKNAEVIPASGKPKMSSGVALLNYLANRDRRRRQALAIGATLLGGFVLHDEWKWLKNELGIGSGTADPGLVHEVHGNDDHLRMLGTHIDGLEKSTMSLRKQITNGILDETMLILFEQIVGLMEEIKDQYGRIYDSIETLISRKRLSTALASPPDVYRELSTVAGLLKQEGMELLMEESQEVYEMDASYILFDNMTLAIYVHLPVGRLSESMRLYRYLPTPFRFDNRSELFMVDPPHQLLASSVIEEEYQMELSTTDFEWCDHIRSTFYCPGRTQWLFDTRSSCLSALFRRDAQTVKEKCAISPITHKDMSVQLDEKTFLLAVAEDEIFRFSCKGELVTSLKISGLIRITVPRGCMIEGDWMKLVPTHNLFFNVGRVRVVKVHSLQTMNMSESRECLLWVGGIPDRVWMIS